MGVEVAALAAYAALAGAAIGAVATVYNAEKQEDIAENNAELTRRQGNQEADAAMAQAEKIRRAGAAQAAQANAAMAASGVSIGEGTPILINESIYKDSESDAYSTLLTGARRKQSAEDQAGMLINEGNVAKTSGYMNAGASLLSAAGSYGKWKTSQKKGP